MYKIEMFGDVSFSGAEDWCDTVTTPSLVASQLKEAGGSDIQILMHSPGGIGSMGIAIYNHLTAYSGKVFGVAMGDIGSVMTIIAMACDDLQLYENTQFMIHEPWEFVAGKASELRKVADDLDNLNERAAKIYADRSGAKLAQIKEWMSDETFFPAKDAVKHGFADGMVKNKKKRPVNPQMKQYKNCPDSILREIDDLPNLLKARKAAELKLTSMKNRTRLMDLKGALGPSHVSSVSQRGAKPTEK